MIKLFRVSFSILDPWSRGDFDEAVRRWMRIPTPATPAMEEGKVFHLNWQDEIMRTGKLPKVFGERTLNHPQPELKLDMILQDWIQFVGIVDCLEDDAIQEFKTGKKNSSFYARTMQIPCYQVLVESQGYHPQEAHVHHYNQHTKNVTHSKLYLSEETAQKASDWIITYASELYAALESQGAL